MFLNKTPILIKYRDYRKFKSLHFRNDLQNNLPNITDETCYDNFEFTFKDILNHYAPIKTKMARANNAPYMNKTLSKAIMTRSRLKNKYHNNPKYVNKSKYRQQRNYCVNLTRRVKGEYYSNLDIKNITDNKRFWDTIKPCLSDKNITDNKRFWDTIKPCFSDKNISDNKRFWDTIKPCFSDKNITDNKRFWDTIKPCLSDKNTFKKKIMLIEKDSIITEDAKVAETMNTFFPEG